MDAVRDLARAHGQPLTVSGFGAAFALHFTARRELRGYRDTLDDDSDRLGEFLALALEEGLHLLPDGRLYVSAAHTEADVRETLGALGRVFARLREPAPLPAT
jgi:glutamate-1-semialdehyde 2,1-aminomutase